MSDTPLYGCRNQWCAEECTWPESDLMEHPEGGPICGPCWDEEKWDYCDSEADEFPPSLNRWRSSQSLERDSLREALEETLLWLREAKERYGSKFGSEQDEEFQRCLPLK